MLQSQEKIRWSNWFTIQKKWVQFSQYFQCSCQWLGIKGLFLPYKDISNKIHFRRVGEYLFVIGYLVVIVGLTADCFLKLLLYTVECFKPALYQITITISCRNSGAVHSRSLKYQWLSVKTPGMSWNIAVWGQKPVLIMKLHLEELFFIIDIS